MMTMRMAGVCLLAAGLVSVAQEEGVVGFKHTLSAGVALTDGNSETLQANAAFLTEGEKAGLGSVRAGLEGNYGESTVDDATDTTVENARAFAGARKTLSPRTFTSLDASVMYDDIARIDYRAVVAPGLGAYLVKSEATALSLEAGPAYLWEEVAGVSDDFLALRFAERFEHAIGPTAKVWQSVEFLPQAEDFDDYLLNAELGVEAALNAHMNLRTVLQNRYDNTPGEGLEKNDLALITGIGVSL